MDDVNSAAAKTGATHPIESHIAAAIVTVSLSEQRQVVYALLDAFGPMTDDELKAYAQRTGMAESSARSR